MKDADMVEVHSSGGMHVLCGKRKRNVVEVDSYFGIRYRLRTHNVFPSL